MPPQGPPTWRQVRRSLQVRFICSHEFLYLIDYIHTTYNICVLVFNRPVECLVPRRLVAFLVQARLFSDFLPRHDIVARTHAFWPPAGWSKSFTKTGETYYRNDHDKTTTWDKPTEASTPTAVAGSSKSKGQEKPRSSKSSSGEPQQQQEQPLPPGERDGDEARVFPQTATRPFVRLSRRNMATGLTGLGFPLDARGLRIMSYFLTLHSTHRSSAC